MQGSLTQKLHSTLKHNEDLADSFLREIEVSYPFLLRTFESLFHQLGDFSLGTVSL